jgi:hypothetical protein
VSPVVELFAESAADFEAQVGVDRQIPIVEQLVKIAAEQDSILNSVRSLSVERADVRRRPDPNGCVVTFDTFRAA